MTEEHKEQTRTHGQEIKASEERVTNVIRGEGEDIRTTDPSTSDEASALTRNRHDD